MGWRRLFFSLLTFWVAASVPVRAAAAPYTMTVRGGFIAVRDEAGRWVYRSQVPPSLLSDRDRLLLEAGLPLWDRADFTRAVEDFCS